MSFDMDGYVDVAERITLFYEKFPDGRLTRLGDPEIREVGPKLFVIYSAEAYRTADDPHPAVGTAWEPFPGPTQFTRDSELMNAETAAWGRAIIACGIGSKKIASSQEVQARTGDPLPVDEASPEWKTAARNALGFLAAGDPRATAAAFDAVGAGMPSDVAVAIVKAAKAIKDTKADDPARDPDVEAQLGMEAAA